MHDPLDAPPASAAAALAAPRQRVVQINQQTGLPEVITAPLITKGIIADLYGAVAAETFECPDPLDPDHRYHGMTIAEVLVRKQVASAIRTGEIETVMDRLAGRPKQESLNVKVTATYEETLREIERKEAIKRSGGATPPRVLEAQVVREDGPLE